MQPLCREIHFIVYNFVCQSGVFWLQGGQATAPVFEDILVLKYVREDTQKQARLAKQLLWDNVAKANTAAGWFIWGMHGFRKVCLLWIIHPLLLCQWDGLKHQWYRFPLSCSEALTPDSIYLGTQRAVRCAPGMWGWGCVMQPLK